MEHRSRASAHFLTLWILGWSGYLTSGLQAAPCPTVYNIAASASGNGVADDADRIQAVIDGSCVNTTIDFGPGTKTYLLSHHLVLKPNRIYSGSATLKMRNPTSGTYRGRPVDSMFRTTYGQSNGITIAGLTLDGNSVASGIVFNVDGGTAEPAQNFYLHDCVIKNGVTNSPWMAGLYAVSLQNARILNNRFSNQSAGVVVFEVQHVVIQGNDFDTIARNDAINLVQFSRTGVDLQVRNNTGRRLSRMAIEVFGGAVGAVIDGVVVDGNTFTDWVTTPASDYFGISVVVGSNAKVTRNTLSGGLVGYGIEAGVPGLLVDGNTITGFPIGIAVQGQSDIVVQNNRLVAQTDCGIMFSNSGRGINRRTMILNNTIDNSQKAGINSVPNDAGGSVIRGNTITRGGGFFPGDARQSFPYFAIKGDTGQTSPITFQSNTLTQTAANPPAGFQFWGFGLFGHLAAGGNVFDGNTIQSQSNTAMGTGFNLWVGGLLDGDVVRNTRWLNLSKVDGGNTSSRITISNNLTCGVITTDPWLATGVDSLCFLGAARRLSATPVTAAAGTHPKVGGELDPTGAEGLMDVIVQFKEVPTARQHSAVANRGGVLRQELALIKGGLYTVPSSALALLGDDPEVVFVQPDRTVTSHNSGSDDAESLPFDGAGIGIAVIDSVAHDTLRALTPGAQIVDLRLGDESKDSDVIRAIAQAITEQFESNIRVLYVGLGRAVVSSSQNDALCQAVEAAWKAGIVVVVPGDGMDNSPANDAFAITVGALNDARSPKPDLAAPTAHTVIGAAAILLQKHPELTPDEVKAILKKTATAGARSLNVQAALDQADILTAATRR